jgi:hypothetical protein
MVYHTSHIAGNVIYCYDSIALRKTYKLHTRVTIEAFYADRN